ncbi:unnamed protein product [Rhizoctonia solani]|uniref:Uncharacterized protein n=1 Tax=Rhizoctonia solani TaxID=456999 RepID=A0A8H2XN13_9AGAM|nr:unnamed protein product [Rhizoctonia solani]
MLLFQIHPTPTPVIDKNETSVYLGWFRGLETDDAEVFNLVRAVITVTNKLERYAPINAENELWFDPDGEPLSVPLVIPQSPPVDNDVEVFTRRFWAHRTLFGRVDGSEEEGSFSFFGKWHESQSEGPLYDHVTKTYRGGKLGIAWNTRGLLKVTANIGAALGKIEPPKEAPADYNLGGPRIEDWNKCVHWLREWREHVDKAVANLSLIIPDRTRSVALATLPTSVPPKPRKRAAPKGKQNSRGSDKGSDIEEDGGDHGSSPPAKRAKRANTRKNVSPSNLLLVPDRATVDFSTRNSIFGPKPPTGPVQRFNGTLQALSTAISAFNSRCKRFVTRYNEVPADGCDPYDPTLLSQVRARIHDKYSGVRPLFESVLKQRGNWLKAETLWSRVEPLFREGRQILKEGLVLQRAIDKDTKGHIGPAANRGTHQLAELTAFCWAVKCIVRRFSRFFSLSLCWANYLKDEWESIPMTATAPDLVSLVAAIRDWHNDYRTLLQKCIQDEEDAWKEHELKRHNVPNLNNCWYTFGCPTDGALSPLAITLVEGISSSKSFVEIEEDSLEVQEPPTEKGEHIQDSQSLDNPTPPHKSIAHKPMPPAPDTAAATIQDDAALLVVTSTNQPTTNSVSIDLSHEERSDKERQENGHTVSECEQSMPTASNIMVPHGASPGLEAPRNGACDNGNQPTSQRIEIKETKKGGGSAGTSGSSGGRGRGKGRGTGGGSKANKGRTKGQEEVNPPEEERSSLTNKGVESELVRRRPQRKRIPTAKLRDL